MGSPPRPAAIRRVVEYLENELELKVYGQCRSFDPPVVYEQGSLMDYSVDDILKLRMIPLDKFESQK